MKRVLILALVSLPAAAVFTRPPLEQDLAYHYFADQRAFLGIANFLNVISNAGFLAVGIAGLIFLGRQQRGSSGRSFTDKSESWPYFVFFSAVALTSFGSAAYHLAPDNTRLVWDRLPMALGFMGFFSAVIAERISPRLGLRLLPPLTLVGIASVLYWGFTEQQGRGDLRFYILVQFYPMLAIPAVLLLWPPRYTRGGDFLGILAIYSFAKVVELLDKEIFALGHVVSGHTLKHVIAAFAAYWILRMLRRRRPKKGEQG